MEKAGDHAAVGLFRLAMLVNGVDLNSKPGALISTAHTDDDITQTAEATRRALAMLKAEGLLHV
jgi:glutamate-1-semialdehyde aminotransferase